MSSVGLWRGQLRALEVKSRNNNHLHFHSLSSAARGLRALSLSLSFARAHTRGASVCSFPAPAKSSCAEIGAEQEESRAGNSFCRHSRALLARRMQFSMLALVVVARQVVAQQTELSPPAAGAISNLHGSFVPHQHRNCRLLSASARPSAAGAAIGTETGARTRATRKQIAARLSIPCARSHSSRPLLGLAPTATAFV